MTATVLISLLGPFVFTAIPCAEESDAARGWVAHCFSESQDPQPFFSFTYGGRPSTEFLSEWALERTTRQLDEKRIARTLHFTDPATALEIRCVGIEYQDFPTVEWTLHFRNGGSEDSPILSDIQAIDARFPFKGDVVLHRNTGDRCTADSFEPHSDPMPPGSDTRIANTGGRPTQEAFPYFNITGPDEGLVFAVSWAGQWAARFVRDEAGLRLVAGQEQTHFMLHPGEAIRTPLIVLQFHEGGRTRAQNIWRSWMIAHNMPRPGGKLPPVPQLAACSSHQFGEMIHANRDNQIFFVDQYLERGIKLDYWWMDAGWYLNESGWPNTGTWEVDTERFPGGLRAITDHAHGKGVDSLLWFEPERVTPGTWLYEERPQWLLGKDGEQKLLNLGDPEAREWLTDHVDKILVDEGIDLYRQDFNMDPLSYWRANDTEDRQGITEIRHVEGYFAYWDELRRRHPDMLIDSCASGGRRNDLETLRRAVPLLRSDYIMEPVGNQCHTYALSSWFPFYGTGTSKTDPYLVRSVLCPHFIAVWDMRDDQIDFEALRRMIDEWRVFAPNFMGDFYPLTPYSLAEDAWIAWQFDRPETGQGMVQAFRRAESDCVSMTLPLQGLDPDAAYTVENVFDPGSPQRITGRRLLDEGLPIHMEDRPGTACFTYTKRP